MAVMEIVLKAVDQVSETVQNIAQSTGQAGNFMEQNWMAIGAGAAVAGAGVMKVTGRAEELNEGLRRVSIITGETEDSLRGMTQAMTDHTFSNDDAVAGMERLIRSGVDQKDQFEALLPAFDNFSDATGKDMVASIDLFDRTLSALGIPLEEAEDHMDTLTHVMTQTDIPLGTLQRNLGRVPDELQAMNFGLDDSIAAIQYFRDQGYSGEEAVRNFRRAVAESEGDLDAFMEITGMTAEELAHYQEQVGEAAGLTDVLAESNNQNIGILAKFKAGLDDAMWSAGSFLEPIRDLGPLMMGLGPAIKGVSMAKAGLVKITTGGLIPGFVGAAKSATSLAIAKGKLGVAALKGVVPGLLGAAKAAWAFTAALLANPITWIVIAIIALIAAIYLLWKNWDQVSAWLANSWEWIKEKAQAIFGGIADFFGNFGENVKAIFSRVWDAIKEVFSWSPIGLIAGNWDTIKDYFGGLWERIKEALGTAWEWIKGAFAFSPIGLIAGNWDQIAEFFSGLWERIKEFFSGGLQAIWDLFLKYHPLGIIITHWDEITEFFGQAWERIKEIFSAALSAIVGWVGARIEAMRETITSRVTAIQEFFSEAWDRIKDIFSTALEAILTWVKDRLAAIKGAIVYQFTAAGEFISEAWEKIKQTTADALAAIIAWVQDRLTAMKETIVERITEAREFISQAWEQIKEIFSAALDAVLGFIRTKFENAKSNITNAWNAIKDFFATTWASIKQLFSGALGDIIQSIAGWAGDLAAKAREAGGNLVNGFIDAVKGLPGRLWGILMDAVKKLINVGGQLWTAAKNAGEKIWSGIKKGLGKSSPGHIERAIDEISNRAAKLPKEMAQSFSQIKGLDATPGAKIAVQGLGAGAGPADSVAGAPAMEWADLSSEQKAQIEKAAMAAEKQMMDSMGKTYATLTAEEKNQVMARGREVEQEMMESLNRRESALTERIKKMTGKVADMTGLAVKAQQIREDIKQRAEQAVEVASSLDAKAQQIRADLESRAGAINGSNAVALATPSAGGDSIVHNHFHISDIVIRDDRDIEDLAKQLYALWKKRERGVS